MTGGPHGKLSVQVDLMPVTVGLEAQPGDHVMVLNGVVVGVYTGRAPGVAPAAPAATAKPAGAAAPAKERKERKEPAPPGKPAILRRGKPVAPMGTFNGLRDEYRDKALALITARPGMETAEVVDALGVSRDDPHRWVARDVLKRMIVAGVVRGELVGSNAKLGKRFYPVEQQPQQPQQSPPELALVHALEQAIAGDEKTGEG